MKGDSLTTNGDLLKLLWVIMEWFTVASLASLGRKGAEGRAAPGDTIQGVTPQ